MNCSVLLFLLITVIVSYVVADSEAPNFEDVLSTRETSAIAAQPQDFSHLRAKRQFGCGCGCCGCCPNPIIAVVRIVRAMVPRCCCCVPLIPCMRPC